MTGRKCGTCKHFEPAQMWRKGWCRNPLLFSPQQSHLVNDEDLDCERGMGNYWESMETIDSPQPVSFAAGFKEDVSRAFTSKSGRNTPLVSEIGNPVYPVMGAAGQGGDRPPYDEPPGDGWSGGDPPNPSGREYNYYPEERYWTDYLRIAAPILGVILMVFLFWWWITNFIGDDDPDDGNIAGNATSTVTIQTIGETPDASAPPAETTGTPGGITIPTQPAGGEATQPPAEETDPPEQPSGIYNGATVEVFNTGGTGLNVRTEPSADAEIITQFLDGTVLTVIGDSISSGDFIWWPVVSSEGIEGYVVQDYLSLIE